MIQITNLSKKYGDYLALDGVTCDIEKHKITAILGENGSGKSTLLSLIGRLLNWDQGMITLNDQDIKTFSTTEYAQTIATLKQSNVFNLRLRVYDLVAFGRYPHNPYALTQGDHLIIEESLSFMRCIDLKDRYIDELSGGQRQRVLIAMILAQDTEYILLDEPLNSLDLRHAHDVMVLLRELVDKHGKTVVIVLHDLNIAYRYCDNVIALKHGRLICEGVIDDVLHEANLHRIYDLHFSIQKCSTHQVAFVE